MYQVDVRHARCEPTAAERCRLLAVAKASLRAFRGLSGEDRHALYALACGSGFRVDALASLTPDSFDLEGPTSVVVLAARRNKSRKQRTQLLPADVNKVPSVLPTTADDAPVRRQG